MWQVYPMMQQKDLWASWATEGGGRLAPATVSGLASYVANGWQKDTSWNLTEQQNAAMVAVRFASERAIALQHVAVSLSLQQINKLQQDGVMTPLIETPKPGKVTPTGIILDRYLL
eukprot:TRINITY_DN2715_c1_g1_i3.p1 TRINITY_DN2715_c1_g1~~TRINITY_DN2715_c1_g1_i3.p1  ORF type:complete len:116 (+),score=14.49 TRINITY_DN2715_c1_g1_i3:360-707(+)